VLQVVVSERRVLNFVRISEVVVSCLTLEVRRVEAIGKFLVVLVLDMLDNVLLALETFLANAAAVNLRLFHLLDLCQTILVFHCHQKFIVLRVLQRLSTFLEQLVSRDQVLALEVPIGRKFRRSVEV